MVRFLSWEGIYKDNNRTGSTQILKSELLIGVSQSRINILYDASK